MKNFCIEISGKYACFTDPALKVERVSYPIPTPSACRGIFDAIYWHPPIRWQITKIEVLSLIKYINIRRNEINSKQARSPLFIEDDRTQRYSLILQDVKYRVHAYQVYTPGVYNEPKDDNPNKHIECFRRRAEKGRYFHAPYLGCREFVCDYKLIDSNDCGTKIAIPKDNDYGFMLYDVDLYPDGKMKNALYYHAVMNQGVINVPDKNSSEVRR